jgi:hypothetical protein
VLTSSDEAPMNNALRVIHPYLDHGMWVFDDAAAGLVREVRGRRLTAPSRPGSAVEAR